mgnify:CR=1 FL=1
MNYCFNKVTDLPFEMAVEKVKGGLRQEGFGVLTDIDVQTTLRQKLGVDFRKYRILGACNPAFAHQALQAESRIGTMLPCNVVVQELPDGKTEVAAINPLVNMQQVGNPRLEPLGAQVAARLQTIVEHL